MSPPGGETAAGGVTTVSPGSSPATADEHARPRTLRAAQSPWLSIAKHVVTLMIMLPTGGDRLTSHRGLLPALPLPLLGPDHRPRRPTPVDSEVSNSTSPGRQRTRSGVGAGLRCRRCSRWRSTTSDPDLESSGSSLAGRCCTRRRPLAHSGPATSLFLGRPTPSRVGALTGQGPDEPAETSSAPEPRCAQSLRETPQNFRQNPRTASQARPPSSAP